jgi:hypothetical protein
MTPRPKQVVIEKSTFIEYMNTKFETLRAFCGGHLLLLSDTLLYEHVTDTTHNPATLLDKCEELLKSGAYYCSMWRRFIEWECTHCQPYPWFLADLETTNSIRNGEKKLSDLLGPEIVDRARGPRWHLAEEILLNVSRECKRRVGEAGSDLGRRLYDYPVEDLSRFRKILDEMSLDIHDMAARSFPYWIRDSARVCLSDAWMTWQLIRLHAALSINYTYLRQRGGDPGRKRAEHDLQDAEYVFLLSRAGAIVGHDKGLTALAKAAFPEKDVFSRLEEVPASYRCDWTNR